MFRITQNEKRVKCFNTLTISNCRAIVKNLKKPIKGAVFEQENSASKCLQPTELFVPTKVVEVIDWPAYSLDLKNREDMGFCGKSVATNKFLGKIGRKTAGKLEVLRLGDCPYEDLLKC